MNAVILTPRRDLRLPVDELVRTHGPAAVAWALLVTVLRRRRARPPPLGELSDHIRRDIGLEPRGLRPDPTGDGRFWP